MQIIYDAAVGDILATISSCPTEDAYKGDIPPDFELTYGLGKYKMVEGCITEVPNWISPKRKYIL